jgi:hypothetical protein
MSRLVKVKSIFDDDGCVVLVAFRGPKTAADPPDDSCCWFGTSERREPLASEIFGKDPEMPFIYVRNINTWNSKKSI